MLAEVMRYVNNRFDRDPRGNRYGSASGHFSVNGGELDVDGLKEGQYFWVEGSVLNDGLHMHPDTEMRDEEFDGNVVFLVVPSSFEDLASEIADWMERNANTIDGALQSESFGGYSYSRESGGTNGNEMPAAAWQVHFGARLRPYRKLSRDWV